MHIVRRYVQVYQAMFDTGALAARLVDGRILRSRIVGCVDVLLHSAIIVFLRIPALPVNAR